MSKESSRPPMWSQPPLAWLFSLRVGLVLLAILTVASIYGTMITPLERAQALVYYSGWYKTLLCLLAINMGCSTYRTIVDRILPQRRPRFMRVEQFYEAAAASQTVPYRGNAGEVAEAFRRRGFQTATEGSYGYAARGLLSRWGAPIAHLGFVIVLLGSFASKWTSREGVVQLPEGGQTDEMFLRPELKEKVPLGFTLRCEDFDT
jgi:cytochrome c biogenesis protein